jgi:transcriptional regulator with XRE-family HTH domain
MLHYLGFSWEQIVTIENPTPSAVFDAINTSLRGTFPNHPSALAAKIARARLGSKCTLEQAAELSRTTARELIGYESGERDTEGMPIAVLCGYARRANVGVGELLELKPISSQSDPDLWDLAFEEVIEQIASQLAHQRVKVDIRLFRKLIPIAHADYMGYLTEKHPSRGTLNRGGEIRVGPKWIDSLLLRAEGSSET